VPVLVGLDRSILERPPDDESELPTMLHQPDPRDVSDAQGDAGSSKETATARPTLASEDVS
jgi:hypothetical protein